MGGLHECLSLLPQGKGRKRDQNRKASGDGGRGEGMGSRLEMELANVKHMFPRKQNAVVVSGAWEVGLRLTRI